MRAVLTCMLHQEVAYNNAMRFCSKRELSYVHTFIIIIKVCLFSSRMIVFRRSAHPRGDWRPGEKKKCINSKIKILQIIR